MLNKEKIIEIIKSDYSYNEDGRYSRDFRNDEMILCCEYPRIRKLERLLAFSGKEMSWEVSDFVMTVTIIADDGQQMLLKELSTDEEYVLVEFWLVNKLRLTAEKVWEYID